LAHKGLLPSKEDLANWISHALKRALTEKNIVKGFQSTGIYSLHFHAMDTKIGPSKPYGIQGSEAASTSHPTDVHAIEEQEELPPWKIQEILEEDTTHLPSC